MKRYLKPKTIKIEVDMENLMAGSGEETEIGGSGTEADIKAQTFRIFDDSFDDLSSIEESDYATTTNTIEVW